MAAALLLLLGCACLTHEAASQRVPDPNDLLMNDLLPYAVTKRDLESNQFVPAYRRLGEPSCEELRAMWRLGKREARRATSTNHLPRALPYRYGRIRAFAPPATYGLRAHSFGAMKFDDRHRHGYRLPQTGAFNNLRSMVGGRRIGAMSELRDAVAKERTAAPEDTPRGQYDNLRGILMKEYDEAQQQQQQQPVALSLRARDDGSQISSRRDPLMPLREPRYQEKGFTGLLLAGDPRLSAEGNNRQLWTPSLDTIPYDARDCALVRMRGCHSDSECACAGQFLCSDFRCVVLPQGSVDQFGIWYHGALPPALLRDWPVPPEGLD